MQMTKQEALERINELEKFIEETDKEEWVWRPRKGEEYWGMGDNGTVYTDFWVDDEYDNYRYDTDNCLKTREEALAHGEWLIARDELIRDAKEKNEGWEPDWYDNNEEKWYTHYNYLYSELHSSYSTVTRSGEIYFKNKDLQEKSHQEHEAEWLIYLNVNKDKR